MDHGQRQLQAKKAELVNVLIDASIKGEQFEMTVDVEDSEDYVELSQAIVTNFLREGRGEFGEATIHKVTPIII
jgi:hypothetical protein